MTSFQFAERPAGNLCHLRNLWMVVSGGFLPPARHGEFAAAVAAHEFGFRQHVAGGQLFELHKDLQEAWADSDKDAIKRRELGTVTY